MKIFRYILLTSAALAFVLFHSGFASDETHLEIPKLKDTKLKSEVLTHRGYTVSYNSKTLLPNWVAYELTDEEASGTVPRGNKRFRPDPDLKGRQACDDDYRGSGYDRGHMAPAADMKWSEKSMTESFYFTNCCPQNHNLNGGDWENLEEKVRSTAQKWGRVYVCCGPIVGKNEQGTIGENKVVVPDAFFKVLMVETKVFGRKGIGFVMKNKAGKRKLIDYATTIDEVEELTGIDFFYSLPDDEEEKMESSADVLFWLL